MRTWQLSVDTGGTFTDCFCTTPEGSVKRLKVLSNSTLRGNITGLQGPQHIGIDIRWEFDPSLLKGYSVVFLPGNHSCRIRQIRDNSLETQNPLPEKSSFTHFEVRSDEEVPVFAARLLTGTLRDEPLPRLDMRLGTTRGTNALLERAGAKVIFLTTKGFRDLLRIGNQQRPDLFALDVKKDPPVYSEVFEIQERLAADGQEICPLDETETERIARDLHQYDPDSVSVAITLMHSYKYSHHEHKLAEHLRAAGFKWVSCSADLSANSKILSRAGTTVVNAYLSPIMDSYFGAMRRVVSGSLKVMTSAGHLAGLGRFHPKDGLLSGPAGGVKGAAAIGRQCGTSRMVTFDMGGTSTDVSMYDGSEDFAYETRVGGATIQAPCLAIDTIAAGGGSICTFDGQLLQVGPESAGAQPGPACYGSGGPLTVTDINLLAGRINPRNFSIPLQRDASEARLQEMIEQMSTSGQNTARSSLIRSLLHLTTEKMARSIRQLAIRKGIDVSAMTLVTYGGAGGQHACDLAEQLAVKNVLVPFDAGLLSAYGIRNTEVAHFSEQEVLAGWEEYSGQIESIREELYNQGKSRLVEEGYDEKELYQKSCYLYLRFRGQESSIEIAYSSGMDVEKEFEQSYRHLFGHWLDNKDLELVSVKVVCAVRSEEEGKATIPEERTHPEKGVQQSSLGEEAERETPVYRWESLSAGDAISGPAILGSENCTVYLKEGWELVLDTSLNAHLAHRQEKGQALMDSESANLALFTNRFTGLVEEMGAILQRTSFSVNVKERVDFSCALLDHTGRLVANAPHIPVHLGSMGLCVRKVLEEIDMKEGDVVLTNHPKFGGSHLPDITLISPVYFEGQRVAFVANRAHHAEIGGRTPGSMPPDATHLEEEGIIFSPTFLLRQGTARWEEITGTLVNNTFPSRAPEENLADLRGALASIQSGVRNVRNLCAQYGADKVMEYMDHLYSYAGDRAAEVINELSEDYAAEETLDDGNILAVSIRKNHGRLRFDFDGSAPVHPGNLNATPAIVRSVVLYVMRLLLAEDLPLNEGILRDVEINLPQGLLDPGFAEAPYPAVVGGNTEISQRLTDTLLKALDLSACSYGTMNNVIFGNNHFGFYETICGGTGAGQGYDGCDAVHQHMTNTRITDPEIIELRYPVRLEAFEVLENTGGSGRWKGGDGVRRSVRFLEPVELSVLTQHRKTVPYGKHGGKPGKPGRQWIERDGEQHSLASSDHRHIQENDLLIIETPGGGGWGDQDG